MADRKTLSSCARWILAACLLGALAAPSWAEEWQPAKGPLLTQWANDVSPANALPEYPRPALVRKDWQNLNGLWDYAITAKSAEQSGAFQGRILVPFPIESALSGVMKPLRPQDRLWYRRTFSIPQAWQGNRILLHFGAVDWEARVTVNGRAVGEHRGGYDAFTLDITSAIKPQGEQELVVSVWDPSDSSWQLHGKQALRPAGCSYTASSGIWQTVWLEPVPRTSIESLRVVTDADTGVLRLTINGRTPPEPTAVKVTVADGDNAVATASGMLGGEIDADTAANLKWYKARLAYVTTTVDVAIPKAALKRWTPDEPFLYNLTVELLGEHGVVLDRVESYAGVRTISIGHDAKGNTRLMLNGRPKLLPGALDQGFWPDGIYTAPTDAALRFDIEAAKRLGLTALRKHVKTEPQRWYYWADKLGILVFQDMPTGNEGDPFTDLPRSPEAAAQCESEKRALITQLWNHPSIVCWVPFNEGWGQHDTLRYVQWIKALDPTRLVDEASGFPRHGGGDVIDNHGGVPAKDSRRIGITSEDGGFGVRVAGHSWSEKSWTYATVDAATGKDISGLKKDGGTIPLAPLDDRTRAWLTRRVRGLFHGFNARAQATGQSGEFYCQIADVEDECNGLLSYDRAVWKVDPDIIRPAARGELVAAATTPLLPTSTERPFTWRYTTAQPAADWAAPGFGAASWKQGPGGFGTPTGTAHLGTEWRTADIWLRAEITLATVPNAPILRILHDEDFEVYLNGELAAQDSGFISSYDDFLVESKAAATLKPGKNIIAVHCHQTVGGQFIDVGLVDGPAKKPAK